MYGQNSPRQGRTSELGGPLGLSPTKSTSGHSSARGSPVQNQVLSPNRSRRYRSGSPMNIPQDGQYVNPGYILSHSHSHGQNLLGDGLVQSGVSPVHSPGTRTPTYQMSPSHSRSSILMRDRSVERLEHEHGHGRGTERSQGALIRDRSLDRQLDRAMLQRKDPNLIANDRHIRDKSLEREHHLPTSRTIERDMGLRQHGRSRSIDHTAIGNFEFLSDHSQRSSPIMSLPFQDAIGGLVHSQSQGHLLLDFQSEVANLNHECAKLQQELDLTKDKLSSTMNSIKTFWSPELKKERSLRKEESARYTLLNGQFKQMQLEKQQTVMAIERLEGEVRGAHRNTPYGSTPDTELLKRERDKQAKELIILRKTIEELEIRIDTQKQTLLARDESIRKLLEMLQSKGLAAKLIDEDRVEIEQLKMKVVDDERHLRKFELLFEEKEREIRQMREELVLTSQELQQTQENYERLKEGMSSGDGMQSAIDQRDSKIAALENDICVLEGELNRLREEGSDESNDKQVQTLRSQERILKSKVDTLKQEQTKKDADLCALKTKLETVEKQREDQQHHISVLKEQISAKEQRISILQADIEDVKKRFQEKDQNIERKTKQAQAAALERRKVEHELMELRDHMDLKDRKLNVLQRKIENLEDMVSDKESQLSLVKARLQSMHADQSSSDSALTTLEESLAERERQIERLKEQRDRLEREIQEERDQLRLTNQDLKHKNESLVKELADKQTELLELREEISEVRADKLRKDSEYNELEMSVHQMTDDLASSAAELKKLKKDQASENEQNTSELEKRNKDLEEQVAHYTEAVSKSHQEVDRLLEILKEMENEKHEKDAAIKDLNEQVKEARTKVGTLKRSQQAEKTKNAQLLEEARKREGEISEDGVQLKVLFVKIISIELRTDKFVTPLDNKLKYIK